MAYEFKATPSFWTSLESLSPEQQRIAREVFEEIFKKNPQDPRLHPHRINKLSSRFKETVRSVTITGDLRAVFVIRGNTIVSLDIGTHDIYK